MVVKNIQIYGVQISGKCNCKSKTWKYTLCYLQENSLPSSYHYPLGREKYLIPPVTGEDYGNLFQNLLLLELLVIYCIFRSFW